MLYHGMAIDDLPRCYDIQPMFGDQIMDEDRSYALSYAMWKLGIRPAESWVERMETLYISPVISENSRVFFSSMSLIPTAGFVGVMGLIVSICVLILGLDEGRSQPPGDGGRSWKKERAACYGGPFFISWCILNSLRLCRL